MKLNNTLHIKIFSFLILFLVSCTCLKPVAINAEREELKVETLSHLNGTYEIASNKQNAPTLDFILAFKKYSRNYETSKYFTSISVIDDKHLEIMIYKTDTLIKTVTLKGKVKDGYFTTKTKKISPFYFILNVFGTKSTRFGISKSGDLLIDSRDFQIATLIIIPLAGGYNEDYDLVFKKKI